ncbi:MAG: class I SAM-dependent methyltransferase [Leptospirillia bacterium]
MIHKLSRNDVSELTGIAVPEIAEHDRDEMAIPSYAHSNPLIRWLMWRRYETIAQFAQPSKTMSVLEFGCGIGLFLPTLAERYGTVYAIDLYPQYAELLARRMDLPVRFVPTLDSVPDGTLDAVVAADVLEHVEDLPDWVRTFHAKLKPGGTMLVSGPTENWLYRLGRFVAGFSDKADYHHTNIDRIKKVFEENGFVTTRKKSLPMAVAPALFKVLRFERQTPPDP